MIRLVIGLVVLAASVATASPFPTPGPGAHHRGQVLCSHLPPISATPVSATTSDNLATKLGEACGSAAGILELGSGTYSDVALKLGTGGVSIGGECEIRAAVPASKPLLRAVVGSSAAIIQVRNVPHRIRLTNLRCDGRRVDQTNGVFTSICPDVAENGGAGNGICDTGTQSQSDASCIDSRITTSGTNSTCVYGVESDETVFDGIFLRNQDGSTVEASTVTDAGCDSTTCPAISVPSDVSLNSVKLVARGVNFFDSARVTATGINVARVTKQGLQCYNSDECYLLGSILDDIGITGITLLSSNAVALGNTITDVGLLWAPNSTIDATGIGVAITDGGLAGDFHAVASENSISNTWGTGIDVRLQPSATAVPSATVESNSVSGPCAGSLLSTNGGLVLGDEVDDFASIEARGNSVSSSSCSAGMRVQNVLAYLGRLNSIGTSASGTGLVYTTSAIDEADLTTDKDITISAASTGSLANCTLNGAATVTDNSGGGVTVTGCGGSQQSSCTDGVDCYCDRVADPGDPLYDPIALLCEDFESADYYENTANSWAASPPGFDIFRGGNSRWGLTYGPPGAAWWSSGQPPLPVRIGFQCGATPPQVCNYKEYCSEQQGNLADGNGRDCWQGNDTAGIDIQRVGDVDDEGYGLTLDEKHQGRQWIFERVAVGEVAGFFGERSFGGQKTEIGFTGLIALSSNHGPALFDQDTEGEFDGWNASAGFFNNPMKFDEWDTNDHTLFLGNTGAPLSAAPYAPQPHANSSAACADLRDNATYLAGSISCNGTAIQIRANFNREAEWPFGTWACAKGHIKGLGTDNGEYYIWHNETMIFGATGLRFASDLETNLANGINHYRFNQHYNGNGTGSNLHPNLQSFGRYRDNTHIRNGPPVSCASIGWAG